MRICWMDEVLHVGVEYGSLAAGRDSIASTGAIWYLIAKIDYKWTSACVSVLNLAGST